jgi:hypothetical protein
MLPDQALAAKVESDEKAKLDSLRASMSEEEVRGRWDGVWACVVVSARNTDA